MFLYLIETFRRLWSYELKDRVKLYCQKCGTELTNKGGDISAFGGVYCDDKINCVVARTTDSSPPLNSKVTTTNQARYLFLSPGKLQKLIRKGEITNFGKLEQSVSNG